MKRFKKISIALFISFFVITGLSAQELFSFGIERQWEDVLQNKKKSQPV